MSRRPHGWGCPCWDCGYPGMQRRYPRDEANQVQIPGGSWAPSAPHYVPSVFERMARWYDDWLDDFTGGPARRVREAKEALRAAYHEALTAYWMNERARVRRGTHYQLDGAEGVVIRVRFDTRDGQPEIIVGFSAGHLEFSPENLERCRRGDPPIAPG